VQEVLLAIHLKRHLRYRGAVDALGAHHCPIQAHRLSAPDPDHCERPPR
jgi:hypothetical protein